MQRARFDGAEFDCPIYQRERLDVGSSLTGPAILAQLDCTTVIRPGQVGRIDEWKNVIVTQDGDGLGASTAAMPDFSAVGRGA
jgi:N-methylhydantoinase A